MVHPGELSVNEFSYELPEVRIARFPLEERDQSKLLVKGPDGPIVSTYKELGKWLPAGNLLIFNDTRVVPARLYFEKSTGGRIELFCLEHSEVHYASTELALNTEREVYWKVMIGGLKKWKDRTRPLTHIMNTAQGPLLLEAFYTAPLDDAHLIRFVWNAPLPFGELLQLMGELPLPPYMNRKADKTDEVRYQTVYSREQGSVAAPTAGLHFTPALLESLKALHQQLGFVTLHVGAGTFKPVKSARLSGHPMHAEYIDVSMAELERIARHQGPITAVGTTSLRTLESLYWLGVQLISEPEQTMPLYLMQWAPYEMAAQETPSRQEALEALISWLRTHKYHHLIASTQILIGPGYLFRMASGLITNFHQPQSTLLVLIAAVAGPRWKELYEFALQHEFRFLSYGDGMYLKMENITG